MLAALLVAGVAAESQEPPLNPSETSQPPPAQSGQAPDNPSADQHSTEIATPLIETNPPKNGEAEPPAHAAEQGGEWERDIAIFTRYLFWATVALSVVALFQLFVFGWQGLQLKRTVDATRQATRIAREEFIATHRPRLRIRHVILKTPPVPGQPLVIHCQVVNIGDTTARIANSEIRVQIRRGYPDDDLVDAKECGVGHTIIAGGHVILAPPVDQLVYDPDWGVGSARAGADIRVWITLTYTDDNGVTRGVATRRICKELREGLLRFKHQDPDYEYED